MLLDVTHVTVQSDFILFLEFENGERRVFNMTAYLDQKPWAKLLNNSVISFFNFTRPHLTGFYCIFNIMIFMTAVVVNGGMERSQTEREQFP